MPQSEYMKEYHKRHYAANRKRLLAEAKAAQEAAPERRIWRDMLNRCYREKGVQYARYGGRGITVWVRWRESFAWFLMDVGPRPTPKHSLDRIDTNGNYEPGNVRWATDAEQRRNQRRNRLLTINGETLCCNDWADRYGIKKQTFHNRIQRGVPPELAILPGPFPWRFGLANATPA